MEVDIYLLPVAAEKKYTIPMAEITPVIHFARKYKRSFLKLSVNAYFLPNRLQISVSVVLSEIIWLILFTITI